MAGKERFAAQVRVDGRVTIPVDKRHKLGLEPGDYAVVDVEPIEEVA